MVTCADQGYELYYLDCMEIGIGERKAIFGVDSKELNDAYRKCGEALNDIALRKVNEGKLESAFEYLKRGEQIVAKNNPETLFMILDNIASLKQKQGNAKEALKYLLQALSICESFHQGEPIRRAHIHLNICATASNLQQHSFALRHGKEAIKILENVHDESIRLHSSNPMNEFHDGETISDLHETLAVAYFNTGVEHEHLHEFNLSYSCYQKGREITSQYLSQSHSIIQTLDESIQAVSTKLQNSLKDKQEPF